MKFEDIGKNIQSLVENFTNGKMTTNDINSMIEL